MLLQRGLRNSPTKLQRKMEGQHSETWLQKSIHYLSACEAYRNAISKGLISTAYFSEPPPQPPTPKYAWYQLVYCQNVLLRADEVKAAITSTFGDVLKMDSTKKVFFLIIYTFIVQIKHQCNYEM